MPATSPTLTRHARPARASTRATDIERCPHAWTLRYWADGKQRERSFKDEVRNGRTVYGSGRKLAQDAQLKLTVDKRAGDRTFADYTKAGKANFGEAAEAFIRGCRSTTGRGTAT